MDQSIVLRMIEKITKKLIKEKDQNALYAVPIFVLPDDQTGLIISILLFLVVAFLIYLLERIWMRQFVFKITEEMQLQRILIWEFGTIISIIGAFLLKLYCVILPLLFLLAFLIMWYLIRVVNK